MKPSSTIGKAIGTELVDRGLTGPDHPRSQNSMTRRALKKGDWNEVNNYSFFFKRSSLSAQDYHSIGSILRSIPLIDNARA